MISLTCYEKILRLVVNLLGIFAVSRIEKEEVYLRKGYYEPKYDVDWTIWIHGASLGEVITLTPLVKLLVEKFGRDHVVFTSTTYDGYKKIVSEALCDHASILPIELPEYLFPFINKLKPRLVLINETEIWPLWLANLKKANIPYGIINARINIKTVKLIKLFINLYSNAIDGIKFVFAQNNKYAARFKSLGVNEKKIKVFGSFKYDYVINEELYFKDKLKRKYFIPDNKILWCFGSTHENEEEIILDAFEQILLEKNNSKDLKNLLIILVPRKIHRIPDIEEFIRSKKLSYLRLSNINEQNQPTSCQVILVDKLGCLREIYAMSDMAFVGGSLVRHGGHNVLEPAIFSLPVLTGPYTWNFANEVESLKRENAIIIVEDIHSLKNKLLEYLYNITLYKQIGRNAHNVLNKLSGASQRTFNEICKILSNSNI